MLFYVNKLRLLTFATLFLFLYIPCYATSGSVDSIAESLGLTTSTTLSFPTQTLAASDADSWITSKWSAQQGISFGKDWLAFVSDPTSGSSSGNSSSDSNMNSSTTSTPSRRAANSSKATSSDDTGGSSSSSSVLAATYPAGSYSDATGGAQFYATFGGSAGFEAMLVSYDLAFEEGFNWVKGGKLPGPRGGPVLDSCSGGREPTGSDCFSARVMWRTDGAGEVYGYIPSQPNLCGQDGTICNSDYGFSFGRGKIHFATGEWQNVAVYTKMNDPPSEANGVIALYFNGEEVFSLDDIKFRTSTDVTAGGMYFSTFFGGNDDSWATPKEVHTYYRNFQMYGGAGGSGGTTNSTSNSTDSTNNGSGSGSVAPSPLAAESTGSGSSASGSSETSSSKQSKSTSSSDGS